ncbi:polysaccharide deacetylase [Epilithonimonas sp. JDS]|uniref:polysaccharide deacetylase family protein n=1 Tax=Epilithonimonas sp. JDS TaxID=2902797 RepID=UPI001E3A2EE5|nr:polysaccharide deacetylase family protein [Epilithonimonas sp. JDS]MCD9854927.1 polysaccharide deacetylase [Epilithonimonas sp. JDS]
MILLTFNIAISEKGREKKTNFSQSELISSIEGNTKIILNLLELHEYKATFFVEISIADQLQKLLKTLSLSGHEIGLYNVDSDSETVMKTKQNLEQILDKPIRGLRQKSHRLPYSEIKKMEFIYVSNIEESKIDFLWRKLTEKTEIYVENEMTIVPESQSPYSQLPFNDYVLQVTPMKYYESMLLESLKSNEYVMIYANAWQLFSKYNLPFVLPFYKKISLSRSFEDRLEELFQFVDENEIAVSRMKDYLF